MTHDKVAYWKKRIAEMLKKKFTQLYADLEDFERHANHINLDTREIKKAITNLIIAFKKRDRAFQEAKEKNGRRKS